MTIKSGEVRFCPKCYYRMYLAITSPAKWVHVSSDTKECKGSK